ncbi:MULTISPECIES: phenylalanine--tRNA ligase subunit beta [unclassified Fusibacter]|uniref:phenylalanine--tRNA ligase subunit beta n=1 Tax=unclassified Fusibacter TaxID=2624464 RepID=UPI001012A687|nr:MULTISPECIES: phenylalanine--tRNA ligase subunit beta [unclassified Fusibacter]MCK8058710.1 phenylalanine--tRNA ligase subunit beta [Fusibacter sp. A2]NPE21784.1 phenylalanine--tRNA ligase subunit beta [Fusibacter sp. A1]RXV61357.1 phenylalanine--tRNA ligase subunit beta [Fusibacter sp. A1]
MLVPVKWLNEYVDISTIDIKLLEDRLVMTGSNTEGVADLKANASSVVVGHITSIVQHPNADKLVVCQVDIGADAPIQIVTGAKNMVTGDYVPVALHGAVLADGLVIKKGKLRGEASEGMFCSLQELGFDDKVIPKEFADGLLILDKPYPLGQGIFEAIGLDDHVIEFEITPNRPDCLSMIGMAREAAASFGLGFKAPDTTIKSEVENIKDYAKISVLAADKCPRYACRVVKDVTVASSPQWLQSKLIKAGMRPINNIVDITNYVLLEYGQPIHAFDLDNLSGREIIVRNANDGEVLTTLDDQERKLDESMLVIADGEKAVAIAGVMGGGNSEVSPETKTLLIEVANFNKSSIRETSKKIGLRTEASARFEKGVSPELVIDALNRVCNLIELLGAGQIVGGILDEYPVKQVIKPVVVRPARINKVLGTDLTALEIIEILETLGCGIETNSGSNMNIIGSSFNEISVKPPYYRMDLVSEIDFVEEVGRIFGYDKINSTLPNDHAIGQLTQRQSAEQKVRSALTGAGLSEICTYSFISPKTLDLLNIDSDSEIRKTVMIRNPLGEEFSMMRPTLMANMLQVMSRNIKRQADEVKLYEVGNVFLPKEYPVTGEPIEKRKVIVGVAGEHEDFFTLKGAVETLLSRIKVSGVTYSTEKNESTFHPGRCANILLNNEVIGIMGEVHPAVQDAYEVSKRLYLAEFDFDAVVAASESDKLFTALPKFPTATRDIAITISKEVLNQEVLDVILKHGGDLLESVKLFDVYEGEQIEAGKKSMAYALSFRAADRTLVEEDITGSFEKIRIALEETLKAEIR